MELVPSLWVQKYQIKNEAGIPIEFDNHRFMIDIYNDMSQFQVILKPPQIGMTVCMAIKSMYMAKKHRKQIIYTLPTQGDIQDMVGGSFNRIIAQNPILKEWVRDHDTVEQKQVGDSIIFYRGTFTAKQAMMIPSDLNIHDEVDASDADVITQYETRLQAKADGMRWYYSHPSVAGFGVDIQWQQSDKKEWFVTCEHCHKQQILTFPDNIDREAKIYICSQCKMPMSDEVRKMGKWIPTAKGKFSGYHISQLMCPWITIDKILEDKDNKEEQYFWNYVLGLPYVGSENKITADQVLRNVTSKTNSQEGRILIGVDTGLPIHYVLYNKEGAFYYGKCSDPKTGKDPYADLESLLMRFPNSIMIADQGGDLVGIRQLQSKYPGRVFLCYYRKDRKSLEMIQWGDGNDFGTVVVDRNRMIQLIVEQMRDVGRIRLNGTKEDWAEFASHFDNIYREIKVSKNAPGKDISTNYGVEMIWKRTGPDHFVHALLYALVGYDKYNEEYAKIIGADPLEGLPVGRIFDNTGNIW